MRKVKKTNNEYKKWLFLVIPVIAYFRFFREKNTQEGKREEEEKKNTSSIPRNLMERIHKWVNLFDQNPDDKFVCDEGSELEKILMKLNLDQLKFTVDQVKSSADFLITYAKSQYSLDLDQSMKLNEKAWNILKLGEMSTEVEMRMLDVATILRDRNLMMEVFDRVIKCYTSEPSNPQELDLFRIMFVTAPHLGRWKSARYYGNFQQLEEFHKKSTTSAIPDYEILWNLAEEEYNKYGDTPIDQVKWQEFTIQSHEIKFHKIECQDLKEKKRVEKLRKKTPGWYPYLLDDEKKTKIYRRGACAQMLSPTQSKCWLVGPINDYRMKIQGYEIINGICQKETYELKAITTNKGMTKWEGKLIRTHNFFDENGRQIKKDEIFHAKICATLVKDTGRYKN